MLVFVCRDRLLVDRSQNDVAWSTDGRRPSPYVQLCIYDAAKQTYISLVSSLTKWTPRTHARGSQQPVTSPHPPLLFFLPSFRPIPFYRRFHDFRVYSSTTRTRVRQEPMAPSRSRVLCRHRDIGDRLVDRTTLPPRDVYGAAISSMARNPITVYRRAKNE